MQGASVKLYEPAKAATQNISVADFRTAFEAVFFTASR
jgi:hypothetical protein